MRVHSSSSVLRIQKLATVTTLALLITVGRTQLVSETPVIDPSVAKSVVHVAPQNTLLAIFHDRPVPSGLMPELISTLRENLASSDPQFAALPHPVANPSAVEPGTGQVQIQSGDQITPGVVVEKSVTVYLHGACAPIVHIPGFGQGLPPVSGRLGWVVEDHGHIDPFVHVDCSRVAAMLAEADYGHSSEEKLHIMAGAISRVILHEWIHIATQDSHHTSKGVSRASFSVQDLLAGSQPGHRTSSVMIAPGFINGSPRFVDRLNSAPPSQQQFKAVR